MNDYWDSFDCEIQCEEVYSEDYEYSSVEQLEYSSVCHTEDRGFESRRSCVLNEVPPRGENGSVLLKNTKCLLGDFNQKSRHKIEI